MSERERTDSERPFKAVRMASGCYKVVRSTCCCSCHPPKDRTILYTYFLLPYEAQRQLAETIAEALNAEQADGEG